MDVNDALRSALLDHAPSRGGHGRKAQAELTTSFSRSHLGEYLLQLWGYHLLSARELQRLCAAACADLEAAGGRPNRFLQTLAAMGDAGSIPGNIPRDLRTCVEGQMPLMPVLENPDPFAYT